MNTFTILMAALMIQSASVEGVVVSTDPSGGFQFDHVPPGEYKIFAWTDVDNDAWYEADFMRNNETRELQSESPKGAGKRLNSRPSL